LNDNLIQRRQAIQHLLDPNPADALASYYAFYHSQERTTLLVHRDEGGRADGFIALCRTGMDLFRPLLTLRAESEEVAADLLKNALPPEAAVIIVVPLALRPVIEAFFTVSGETEADIYRLGRRDFQPIINVLVTRAPTPGGDPRFVIRGQSFDRGARSVGPALAAAGINWRSPHFADIYVQTNPQARGRGFGKSVVSALSNWLLEQNVTPLYTVPEDNETSIRLARGLGYKETGARAFLCDGVRRVSFPFHQSMVE
jgi:GNAT superfamily N-acetyltransferase